MKVKSSFLPLCTSLIMSFCTTQTKQVELSFTKDLIPEGIAINHQTKKMYLNSLLRNMIVSCSLDGSDAEIFLEENDYNYLAGFGMTIRADTLYALGNSLKQGSNESILLLLQLSTGQLIDSYLLNDGDFHYWNDLTISRNNEIFITDSESNKIYVIKRPSNTTDIYLDSEEVPNSNGITISDDDNFLYLASSNGIRIVERLTGEILNKPNDEFSGIDGLKFYQDNLYAIVNGNREEEENGLFVFKLDMQINEVLTKNKIIAFTNDFTIPTTFDISDGTIYFIMNTQLDNFDERTRTIINPNKLESYRMISVDLDE